MATGKPVAIGIFGGTRFLAAANARSWFTE